MQFYQQQPNDNRGGLNPWEIIRMAVYRPGLSESVHHTIETQVQIPRMQTMILWSWTLMGYLATGAWVCGLMLLLYWIVYPPRQMWQFWALVVGIVFGLVALVAGYESRALLMDRMRREISHPYADHPTGELLREIIPLLTPQQQVLVKRVPVPIRTGGPVGAPPNRPVEVGAGDLQELGFDDLVAFVKEADFRGLARAGWLVPNQDRVMLPSGQPITRGVYDQIVENLVYWGVISKDANNRVGWIENAEAALQELQRIEAEYMAAPVDDFAPGLEEFR